MQFHEKKDLFNFTSFFGDWEKVFSWDILVIKCQDSGHFSSKMSRRSGHFSSKRDI